MIRPVEMQGVVQRSQDISEIRQNETTRGHVEQAHIQVQAQKAEQARSEQVIKKEESQFGHRKFDAKEKGSNEYTDNRKKNGSRKKDDGKVAVRKSSGFDVKA